MIFNNKKQLLPGLRKSSHGGSTRYPPDDHLKYGESFEAAGVRETRKETEPETDSQRPEIAGITNDFFAESGKHYVTVILKAGVVNGRLRSRKNAKHGYGSIFPDCRKTCFRQCGIFLPDSGRKRRFRYKKTVDDSSFSVLLWQYYAIIFHSQKGGRLLVATIYSESRP